MRRLGVLGRAYGKLAKFVHEGYGHWGLHGGVEASERPGSRGEHPWTYIVQVIQSRVRAQSACCME